MISARKKGTYFKKIKEVEWRGEFSILSRIITLIGILHFMAAISISAF